MKSKQQWKNVKYKLFKIKNTYKVNKYIAIQLLEIYTNTIIVNWGFILLENNYWV